MQNGSNQPNYVPSSYDIVPVPILVIAEITLKVIGSCFISTAAISGQSYMTQVDITVTDKTSAASQQDRTWCLFRNLRSTNLLC